ncbi:MAG: hypothetical protein K4571_04935 [Deltaproteobacteria bacterium]
MDYFIHRVTASFISHIRRHILLIFGVLLLLSLAIFIYHYLNDDDDVDKIVIVKPKIYPTWIKFYTGGSVIKSISPATDGGFIAAGFSDFRGFRSNAWTAKLDAGGNIQWQRAFGDRHDYEFFKISQTADGGYLAAGRDAAWDGFIIKISSRGETKWQKTIPGVFLESYTENSAGELILTGMSKNFSGELAFVVLQLGPDGQYHWYKTYGEGYGSFIRQTADGGYIVLGKIQKTFGDWIRILKIDNAGIVQWQKQYPGILNSAEQTRDGGYLLVGKVGVVEKEKKKNPLKLSDINIQGWLLKLDSEGNAVWHKQFGDVHRTCEDELIEIHSSNAGNFLVLGNTRDPGRSNEFSLIMMDENGEYIWQKNYSNSGLERAFAFQPTADNGYILATKVSAGALVAKVDEKGDIQGCSSPFTLNSRASDISGVDASLCGASYDPRGQDANLVINESNVLSDFSCNKSPLAAVGYCPPEPQAASLCPAEPKLLLQSKEIMFGPYAVNNPGAVPVVGGAIQSLKNVGAADLEIKKIKLIMKNKASWLTKILFWNADKKVISVEHQCRKIIHPGSQCDCTVRFSSSRYINAKGLLVISSNDPVNPVIHIPVEVSVVEPDKSAKTNHQ